MCKYLLFFFINIAVVYSQEFNNRLSLTIDNDKLALLDQYYTSGLLLSYAHHLDNDFLFFKTEDAKLQIEFTLLQQIYTPSNLMSFNVLDFDRPYAGWLGLHSQLYQIKERRALVVGLELGLTGEQSGAGKLQTWWHNEMDINVPTWEQELGNKFLVNTNAKYIYNLVPSKNFVIDGYIESFLGLKTISGGVGMDVFFGKLSSFFNSSRTRVVRTDSSREIYGIIGFSFNHILHNTLIQGDLNYNDRLFTSAITNNVRRLKTGLYYKGKRALLALEYHFLSKETPLGFGQVYGGLSYQYYF